LWKGTQRKPRFLSRKKDPIATRMKPPTRWPGRVGVSTRERPGPMMKSGQ
jgi:hypothetical protein